jgi:hypothetical protein
MTGRAAGSHRSGSEQLRPRREVQMYRRSHQDGRMVLRDSARGRLVESRLDAAFAGLLETPLKGDSDGPKRLVAIVAKGGREHVEEAQRQRRHRTDEWCRIMPMSIVKAHDAGPVVMLKSAHQAEGIADHIRLREGARPRGPTARPLSRRWPLRPHHPFGSAPVGCTSRMFCSLTRSLPGGGGLWGTLGRDPTARLY